MCCNKLIEIIYASTSGNVEAVCQKISDILNENGIPSQLHRAENTDFSVINDNNLFLLATSTWEHGEINPFFSNLLKEISNKDITGKKSAFVGLGDTRYEQILFCKGIDILRETFLKSNGSEMLTTLKINGEPYGYFDSTIQTWTQRLIDILKT